MTKNLRTPFTAALILDILITLAGAFIQNNSLLFAGAALLAATLILGGAALGLFQHTELITSADKPVPFKEMGRYMTIAAIVIAVIMVLAGLLIMLWISRAL
ncbi:hypothetical protein [Lacticaseibacillus songhuajiangensis]|jgi:protein-S-isoprenylcysteine O-methyltransferase Ste14|uniref:hypothetical protein n=1 Tax=Lacticaseibacillus songhuajiangensis TaxID=1296539 RepID=UPI000F7B9418|nr:hypothetical protein [Lacticaseibacillus songhuajiangensis]MCI1284314.1 hypothetical protein [Lacticaseibacillus songhuajiangensis]